MSRSEEYASILLVKYCIMSCSTEIIRVSDDLVVKTGILNVEEYRNQRFAFENLDSSIVRVPQVYRYFEDERRGYMLMDYIDVVNRIPDRVERTVAVIRHIQTIRNDKPGPVGGGRIQGLCDEDDLIFHDRSELQRFSMPV